MLALARLVVDVPCQCVPSDMVKIWFMWNTVRNFPPGITKCVTATANRIVQSTVVTVVGEERRGIIVNLIVPMTLAVIHIFKKSCTI